MTHLKLLQCNLNSNWKYITHDTITIRFCSRNLMTVKIAHKVKIRQNQEFSQDNDI